MKRLFLAATACACLGLAVPAAAQFAKAEDAIKYRKAAFTVIGAHFGRVAAMANGRIPFDAKAAADNAELATLLARLPFEGFVAGSEKGDTRAKPEVWSEADKFKASTAKMHEELAKLNAAAKTGNLDAIKSAVGAVGQSCKGCHDNFRKD